jgi:hypothetical protein
VDEKVPITVPDKTVLAKVTARLLHIVVATTVVGANVVLFEVNPTHPDCAFKIKK